MTDVAADIKTHTVEIDDEWDVSLTHPRQCQPLLWDCLVHRVLYASPIWPDDPGHYLVWIDMGELVFGYEVADE